MAAHTVETAMGSRITVQQRVYPPKTLAAAPDLATDIEVVVRPYATDVEPLTLVLVPEQAERLAAALLAVVAEVKANRKIVEGDS